MEMLENKIKNLPPDIYREVTDFINFLIEKRKKNISKKKLGLNWAGALKEYRDKFTSLELQKKTLEWRK